MRRRLRVTFCLANSGIGGTELNAVRTAERMDPARYDLEVLAFNDFAPLRERYERAGVSYGVMDVRSLRGADWLRSGRQLAKHLRERRVDVFHAHDSYGNLLGVPWARVARTPAVIGSRRWWKSNPGLGHGTGNRLVFRFAHAVITNTQAVANLMIEEGIAPSKIRIIPNFLDQDAYVGPDRSVVDALRAQHGIPDGARIVGIIAQLRPEKDQATLLRAAARIVDHHPDVHFLLIGEGKCRPALEALRTELGLEARVHLAGLKIGLGNLHHMFDISVLCSQTEALSNSILEGMAAANPLTVTDVGGNPDAVIDGETGITVPVGSAEGLGDALDRLLRDGDLARRLGDAGLKRARTEYTVGKTLSTLDETYAALLALARESTQTSRYAA